MGAFRVRRVLAAAILWSIISAGVAWASTDLASPIPIPTDSLRKKLNDQGFSHDDLTRIFSDHRIELYPHITERRGKDIDYFDKRFGLLTRASVARGRRVLSDNMNLFRKLEDLYGVEKEAIVAVFRVETNLGRHTGTYLVFNSLLTLATLPNRRSNWAEEELVHFLVMCRKEGQDPFSVKGSWAGAFGLCQFVPSSSLTYGVDGDGDNRIDLFNFSDAMASIANYLRANGWQSDSTVRKKKALHAYNHCNNYVRAVMAYARACRVGS